ncbi:hypothetical protein WJ972_05975 [Achromobacter insuavis]
MPSSVSISPRPLLTAAVLTQELLARGAHAAGVRQHRQQFELAHPQRGDHAVGGIMHPGGTFGAGSDVAE